jgi:hypothetical protein
VLTRGEPETPPHVRPWRSCFAADTREGQGLVPHRGDGSEDSGVLGR